MKQLSLLALLSIGNSVIAMNEAILNALNKANKTIHHQKLMQNIETSIAQSWQEVELYKKTVYLPFFKKGGFKQEYLEERWEALKSFFNTCNQAAIIFLEKEKNPVAFFTVEAQECNALFYTSPFLLPIEQMNCIVALTIKKYYPEVSQGYCLARQDAEKPEELIKKLGWKQVDHSPIEPNKTFVGNSPYVVFHKTLND